MQDRQPGAPGQYKATLSAAEFQKMQAGEQFTITMVRDDQPIVEGTPYSKAAVLPDNLAAIICPDALNPSPADALRALLPRNGKAPMTANLPMGGHRVTGLGEPVENGDAVPMGYVNEKFRPSTWMPTAADVGARPDTWTPTATEVGAALASHNHDSRYLRRYELNGINIDSTDGNWEVDIAGHDNGTVPVDRVNVTQNTSGHFYTQIAKQCVSSDTTARKNAGLWYREKYKTGAWSAWSAIYHEGAKPTADEIGARPSVYEYPARNGGDLNHFTTETHLFVFNMTNAPSFPNGDFGFFDVCRFSGSTFSPSGEKAIILQRMTAWDRSCRAERKSMDGGETLGAWEYDNPPMSLGVEYRTTERWKGKPVFVKLVSLGAMPNGAQKTVDVSNNGDFVVSADFTHRTADGWTVSKHPSIDISVKRQNNGWLYVDVTATGDMSGYVENYALVKYTKTTD